MFYRAISLAIIAVLVHGSVAAHDQPQAPPQTVVKMAPGSMHYERAARRGNAAPQNGRNR